MHFDRDDFYIEVRIKHSLMVVHKFIETSYNIFCFPSVPCLKSSCLFPELKCQTFCFSASQQSHANAKLFISIKFRKVVTKFSVFPLFYFGFNFHKFIVHLKLTNSLCCDIIFRFSEYGKKRKRASWTSLIFDGSGENSFFYERGFLWTFFMVICHLLRDWIWIEWYRMIHIWNAEKIGKSHTRKVLFKFLFVKFFSSFPCCTSCNSPEKCKHSLVKLMFHCLLSARSHPAVCGTGWRSGKESQVLLFVHQIFTKFSRIFSPLFDSYQLTVSSLFSELSSVTFQVNSFIMQCTNNFIYFSVTDRKRLLGIILHGARNTRRWNNVSRQ